MAVTFEQTGTIPRRNGRSLDACFAAFVLILGAKVFTQLGLHGPLWLAAYLALLGLMAVHLKEIVTGLRGNMIFLGHGLLCLTSTLWSEDPATTLRLGLQVTMTCLMGVYIGLRLSLQTIFTLYLAIYAAAIVLSFLNQSGIFFDPLNSNGLFLGIFISKNALGEGATAFALAGTTAVFFLRDVAWWKRFGLIAIGAATAVLLAMSGSASGLLLTVFGVIGAAGAVVFFHYPLSRAVLLLLGILGLVAATLAFAVAAIHPVDALLGAVGRDATLTGRTLLWQRGLEVFAERPVLGIGFGAYWSAPSYQNGIIAFQDFFGEGVLSFHNLFIELLVACGVFGVLVHLTLGITVLKRAVRCATQNRDAIAAFVVVLVVTLYAQASFGTTLYKPHETSLIALIAFGMALRKSSQSVR